MFCFLYILQALWAFGLKLILQTFVESVFYVIFPLLHVPKNLSINIKLLQSFKMKLFYK